VPPEPRLPQARGVFDDRGCFVVHAPRQTGKTTTLLALAQALTAGGRHAALHFSCEPELPTEWLRLRHTCAGGGAGLWAAPRARVSHPGGGRAGATPLPCDHWRTLQPPGALNIAAQAAAEYPPSGLTR